MTRKWLLIIILIPSRVGQAHVLEKQVITSKFFSFLLCSFDLLFWFLPYRSPRRQGADELMFVGDEWSDRRSLDQVRALSSFCLFSRAPLHLSSARVHAKYNVP